MRRFDAGFAAPADLFHSPSRLPPPLRTEGEKGASRPHAVILHQPYVLSEWPSGSGRHGSGLLVRPCCSWSTIVTATRRQFAGGRRPYSATAGSTFYPLAR